MEANIFSNETSSQKDAGLVVMQGNNLIAALCYNPEVAEHIYKDLISKGVDSEDINLAMSEKTHGAYFSDKELSTANFGNKSLEGLGIGSAIGGTVVGLTAAVAALGSTLVIPALGVALAGSWAAGLAGAGAGAATGGLVGALIGLGITDDQAKILEDGIKNGGILIGVKVPSEEQRQKIYEQLLQQQGKRSDSYTA
jgi:hypothetical protein